MALIKCPECRGQVSDQAEACPHCGRPTTAVATKARAAVGIAAGLLGAGVLAGVLTSQKSGTGENLVPMVAVAVVIFGLLAVLLVVKFKRRSV